MIGRNDPCWCGSGKKYKKCHWKSDKKTGGSPERTAPSLVKSSAEIEGMRRAGAFNAEVMEQVRSFVKAGVSTQEIDTLVHEYTRDHGHTPATLGYQGFPKSCCTSINNVVCHGIPTAKEILKDGDIVNVDLTTIVDGFFGDQSETFLIGHVDPAAVELVQTTARATVAAIQEVAPGKTLALVGDTIDPLVRSAGFSVVRSYTGHGIGRKFHENITVFHHRNRENRSVKLVPGMTFTIEPMINMGGYPVYTDRRDGWTVFTKDGSLSAQFEHTVLVTETGFEVLTLTPSQKTAGEIILIPEIENNV
ncbi:MAG: type I methionyl aminopeptidase [Fibrobacterota bacterium]